jgi:hypothetical protein
MTIERRRPHLLPRIFSIQLGTLYHRILWVLWPNRFPRSY